MATLIDLLRRAVCDAADLEQLDRYGQPAPQPAPARSVDELAGGPYGNWLITSPVPVGVLPEPAPIACE